MGQPCDSYPRKTWRKWKHQKTQEARETQKERRKKRHIQELGEHELENSLPATWQDGCNHKLTMYIPPHWTWYVFITIARSPHLQSNVFKDLSKRKWQLGLACNANSFRVCIGIASLSTQEETCLIPQNCPSILHIPTWILERWPQRITLMSMKRSQYPRLR